MRETLLSLYLQMKKIEAEISEIIRQSPKLAEELRLELGRSSPSKSSGLSCALANYMLYNIITYLHFKRWA